VTAQEHPELSTREIGKLAESDHSTVVRTLQRYHIERAEVEDYKHHRADILAGLQHRLLASCTDADIQKSPMGSRILAAAQLYDKERLERGQSTDNVNVLVAGLKEMQAARWGKSPVDKSVEKPVINRNDDETGGS
jgi:hypothetical protein